uniref:RNA polymerase II-associated factor 1 homolog n=1 Tax=Chlamydomonas leiostraca TaxID=1034604 RepID=A0A7S0S1D8_9CHLO|mmetsp:Transcript_38189/g.96685  ORF Transcript_38189/g.96685 Transcript_38189/m.96685 type:complete len:517 (+) Transcript_38189:121-1671(+)|eukprot:CAMPEP_0202864118 /NCGR_PEP_ID=MMETSP1391-20130828/4486_1 /ASSEMBLY_ACC=CAM_ASM_000867 /TAXON_ID=1034604 /ORGANISM="Chlamydomonas leiostraca, Strain SAG 11-49" /LENGTH=516 /DNA_ID=CAMNT_0049543829 /DNA_START=102 /DNA_END=1652 /DNA_ORIENTATION=-
MSQPGFMPPPPPSQAPVHGARPHSASKPHHHSAQRPHASQPGGHRPPGLKEGHKLSASHHHEKEKRAKEDKLKEEQEAAAAAAHHAALDSRLRRETPFLASIRFRNDLPEVPGDPKLLVSQQPPEKLAQFSLTSLEKAAKRDLVLAPDLGIAISLLDADRYAVPQGPGAPKPELHPADAALLGGEEEMRVLSGDIHRLLRASAGHGGAPMRRSAALRSKADVAWLMRTTYIGADSDSVRRQGISEKEAIKAREAAQGGGAQDALAEGGRDAQVAAIEASFAAARAPPVHRTKPHLRALEVLEVMPDWEWWGHKYLLAHFENDPCQEVEALAKLPNPEDRPKVTARSMLKGFKLDAGPEGKDAGGGRYMALVVPANPAAAAAAGSTAAADGQEERAREVPAEELEGEYKWVKEYSYDLTRKEAGEEAAGGASSRQPYVIRFTEGRALYCDVSGLLQLKKRDAGSAKARTASLQFARPSKVLVRKRPPSGGELAEGDARRKRALLPADAAGGADADMF